jgi:large subunit ribosomal protein L2
MPIKSFSPTSPGRRFRALLSERDLSHTPPEKRLLTFLRKTGGRNAAGRITAYHRGGGHKQKYRLVDFKRDKDGIPARVKSIQYDPNRSSRIALVAYADGEKRYVIAPHQLKANDIVMSGPKADIQLGNCLKLGQIPVGTMVHNVELKVGKGAQFVRAAGSFAQLMAKEGSYGLIRLPSGELRRIHLECKASVGQVGNLDHANVSLGKAGTARWLGRRPVTRGVAMNPVDHPHGGGEGRSKGNHPQTPWGRPTKGYKTRVCKRSDSMIVKRRTR